MLDFANAENFWKWFHKPEDLIYQAMVFTYV
ncbi:MAG: hypothetical protein G01um101425_372 [Candidatus Peregrinibacteria bacterium Gr01-1014_25]|nr:MAG: hypothetical protein G01um101425_372 [Candidatus Peregrinibacteria bacterium Gr01-1014_25]